MAEAVEGEVKPGQAGQTWTRQPRRQTSARVAGRRVTQAGNAGGRAVTWHVARGTWPPPHLEPAKVNVRAAIEPLEEFLSVLLHAALHVHLAAVRRRLSAREEIAQLP